MVQERLRKRLPVGGELDIAPWDALLAEVRRSAYRVEWVSRRVQEEADAEERLLAAESQWEPGPFAAARMAQSRELREWLKLEREERSHGAAVARGAVSAGLSERYIESVQAEARMIANVLQRALQAAQLTPEQWAAATDELRIALADVGRELNARHAAAGPYVKERPQIES